MTDQKRISRFAAILLLATLTPLSLAAQKQPAAGTSPLSALGKSITTRTLKNGMKVILWPDHDIPNVAMYIWYRVGSRNERPGITGLSHFFEHMMFNGAAKYGAGEFDRVMEANGGANNAYTSENVTVYQNWFPRTALELIFDLEADRIHKLSIDPKIIESERGVVYSERRSSVDNDNSSLLNEQIQATAFVAHPYQFPVIGWPSDIEAWKQEDLVTFFKTYYAPNNATMLIVGDVKPEEIYALAKKYLEPIPRGIPPAPVTTKEPEQQGERRLRIVKAAQVPLLQMAFHIGAANAPDAEATELLMNILSSGESSRLHKRLVEKEQQAISVGGYRQEGFDPGLAWVFVTLSAEGDLAKTESILDEEFARIAKDGPSEAELRKVKNSVTADFWRALSTINGKAQALGAAEVYHGDYRTLFDVPARYERVTRNQVRDAAAKYLTSKNRTVGVLVPEPSPEATPSKGAGS